MDDQWLPAGCNGAQMLVLIKRLGVGADSGEQHTHGSRLNRPLWNNLSLIPRQIAASHRSDSNARRRGKFGGV